MNQTGGATATAATRQRGTTTSMIMQQFVHARLMGRAAFVIGAVFANAPLTDMPESQGMPLGWIGVILMPASVCFLFVLRRIGKRRFPECYS